MADVFKAGGTAGQGAYIAVSDAGALQVSDGTTVASLSRSVLTTLGTVAGYLTGLVLDYSSVATGAAYVSLTANLASAWAVKQGSTAMATFVTTTSKWRFKLGTGTLLQYAAPVTATITANHALVFGTAGANETAMTSNVVFLNNTSGSSKDVSLPTASDCVGVPIILVSLGGSSCVIKSGGNTLGTIAAGKAGIAYTDGSSGGLLLGS